MKHEIVDLTGKKSGEIELDETVWGIEPNIAVMHQALVAPARECPPWYGGHEDPWRSSRWWPQAVAPEGHRTRPPGFDPLPAVVGGGVVFGPHPRTYTQRMPKQDAPSGGPLGSLGQAGRWPHDHRERTSDIEPKTKAGVAAIQQLPESRSILIRDSCEVG